VELTLVRHGRSLADDEARVEGGGWDAPLTTEGVRQATLLAARLVSEEYACDVFYSSPLIRATAVAEILAAAIGGTEVTHDPRLAELNLGRLSGLLISQAQERYPKPPGGVRSYVPIAGGESHCDHVARVLSFYAELTDCHPDDRVLVVAHGGTLSVLLQIIYGLPLWSPHLEGQWFRFRSGDTGVHRLTIQGHSVTTHYLNDTSHLR
jgi:broad specificity phosphatase PhoE